MKNLDYLLFYVAQKIFTGWDSVKTIQSSLHSVLTEPHPAKRMLFTTWEEIE